MCPQVRHLSLTAPDLEFLSFFSSSLLNIHQPSAFNNNFYLRFYPITLLLALLLLCFFQLFNFNSYPTLNSSECFTQLFPSLLPLRPSMPKA